MNIATVTASSSATATAASSYSFFTRLIGAQKSLMERTAETALSCVSVLYFFSLYVYKSEVCSEASERLDISF